MSLIAHAHTRRNALNRAREDIARKASRSICRNQNLDVIAKPNSPTNNKNAVFETLQSNEYISPNGTLRTGTAATRIFIPSKSISQHQNNILLSQYGFGELAEKNDRVSQQDLGFEGGGINSNTNDPCNGGRFRISPPVARSPDALQFNKYTADEVSACSDRVASLEASHKNSRLLTAIGLGNNMNNCEVCGNAEHPVEELYLKELRIRMKRTI